jgi:diguanylate cyclase (GGDEF)-like protein
MSLYRRIEDSVTEGLSGNGRLRRFDSLVRETLGISLCWIVTRHGERRPIVEVPRPACELLLRGHGGGCPEEPAKERKRLSEANLAACPCGLLRLELPLRAMGISFGVVTGCGLVPPRGTGWVEKICRLSGAPPDTVMELAGKLPVADLGRITQFLPFLQEHLDAITDHVLETHELSILHRSASLVTSRLKIDDILDEVLELCSQLFNADAYSVRLLDPRTNQLVVRASRGLSPAYLSKGPMEVGESCAGRVAATGRPLVVPDVRKSTLLSRRDLLTREGFVSLISVPLSFRERIGGVITLYTRSRKRPKAREMKFLGTMASQVALALANARLYEKTLEMSMHDELTGLFNYRHFRETLSRETERAKRYSGSLALAIFDIDDFKAFNDLHGHQVGDEVLRQVSATMRRGLREIDILCRYGGEEFALICPQTSGEEALALAIRVQRMVGEAEFAAEGVNDPLRVTVSCGVAVFPEDAAEPDRLLTRADAALYAAKASGKNMVLSASTPR